MKFKIGDIVLGKYSDRIHFVIDVGIINGESLLFVPTDSTFFNKPFIMKHFKLYTNIFRI